MMNDSLMSTIFWFYSQGLFQETGADFGLSPEINIVSVQDPSHGQGGKYYSRLITNCTLKMYFFVFHGYLLVLFIFSRSRSNERK